MKNLGYYNGKIDLIENMTIPMLDRVSFFGDGVYDVTYARNHIPYCLNAHLDRFYRSARELRIAIPLPREELGALLCDLVKKVDSPDQMMYWQVTRGTAPREHAFPKDTPANLWVMLRPKGVMPLDTTLTLHSVEDTRFLHCNVKTLNLIPNVMAEQEAKEAGASSALFHRGERVTECAHANVHILRGGFFITPPTDKLILPGIGRQNLLRICEKLGIPVAIRPFTMTELMEADEVISSSSGEFCIRVTEVDGKSVGGKDEETLRKLQDALMEDFLAATGG
jgi:D-alanine transaminase